MGGGAIPRTKTIFVQVPRTKISKGQIGKGSPPRGALEKVRHPQNFEPHFLENLKVIFFQNFTFQRGHQYLSFDTLIQKSIDQFFS